MSVLSAKHLHDEAAAYAFFEARLASWALTKREKNLSISSEMFYLDQVRKMAHEGFNSM